jgi:serine phosphatase RsbU (regulator of sigma subunit)
MTPAPDVGSALSCIVRGVHLAPVDALPDLAASASRHILASTAVMYVVDLGQTTLVPLDSGRQSGRKPLRVEGTLAGRAYRNITVVGGRNAGGGRTVWTPMLDGTERLGVVEFVFGADVVLDEVRDACKDLASLLAEVLTARMQYGDAVQKARRSRPLTLSAELQWRQLPPLTLVTPDVAISGILMPTAEIAGDSFDYSVDGDIASVAIVDALGHGIESTLLSMVAIGALRNGRRSGLSLAETVDFMSTAVSSSFRPDTFVTAIVGQLHIGTGVWTWATCGHPPALVVRRGRVVKTLDSVVGPPLGLHTAPAELGSERLEPGDRILLYTDGVEEARSASGEFFGTRRLVDFVTRQSAAGLPAAETLRRLNLAILDHQEGKLQDDATSVLIEWRGDEPNRVQP